MWHLKTKIFKLLYLICFTMRLVVPTLFSLTKKEFDKKLMNLSFAKRIHVDFMDGIFTLKKSVDFDDMKGLKNLDNVELEVHIMAYEPIKYIPKIKNYNFKKVFLHYEVFETDSDMQYEIYEFKKRGLDVALVLNPGTQVEDAVAYFNMVDSIMLMSVWPGAEGQKFISLTHERIKELRGCGFRGEICVDGGINEKNIKRVFES